MKTRIRFGMFLDGAQWSDSPASLGELTLGPAGLLDFLETRLGLTAPTVHPAIRINQYMAKMTEVDAETIWFHRSFSRDPWATAEQLLCWRDELSEAGWTGTELKSSNRLAAISDIGKSTLPLLPGFGDRLQVVIKALTDSPNLDIAKIELIEPKNDLPPMWQKIIAGLNAGGIEIVEALEAEGGVLSRINGITMLQANNEWEAAEAVATWLAADPEANKEVTIACGAGTRLLDQALTKRGLPTLGVNDSTAWRPYIQLLPMAMANIWMPIDIDRLVDLLSLPISLIRRNEASYLLQAIAAEPGVSGDKWLEALEKIRTAYINKATDGLPEKATRAIIDEAAKHADFIDYLLVRNRYSEDEDAKTLTVADRCYQVIRILEKSRGLIPEYATAVKQAEVMLEIANGRQTIDKKLLERVVSSVAAPVPSGSEIRQVGSWRVISDPRQVVAPAETLVWWGFNEPADKALTYWTNEERLELAKTGSEPEEHTAVRNREALAVRSTLQRTRKHAILVCPLQINGEAVAYHPLWDEITKDVETDDKPITKASAILKKGTWDFAERNVEFIESEREIFDPAPEQHKIPVGLFKRPETNSPSQMGTMISCPYSWALQYQAKIRPAFSLDAPAENQMKGTFCHRIAEEVLGIQRLQTDPEAARTEAHKIYDKLVSQMAAPMLVKGRARKNKRLRDAMGDAVASLATILNERGLTVVETEMEHRKSLSDGTVFRGVIDMVAEDAAGSKFVVDLKWTGSAKKKDEEIKEKRALQLAGYTWLLKPDDRDDEIGGGYYLLAQDDFFHGNDFSGTWQDSLASWETRAKQIDAGRLTVTGIVKENIKAADGLTENKTTDALKEVFGAEGLLYRETFCRYCDYTVLCGVTEAAE